jgi:NTP pyrophosphatase (non-canonical NTP hydrolase)
VQGKLWKYTIFPVTTMETSTPASAVNKKKGSKIPSTTGLEGKYRKFVLACDPSAGMPWVAIRLGLMGESGELADAYKKIIHPFTECSLVGDVPNPKIGTLEGVLEEVGGIAFYAAAYCHHFGHTFYLPTTSLKAGARPDAEISDLLWKVIQSASMMVKSKRFSSSYYYDLMETLGIILLSEGLTWHDALEFNMSQIYGRLNYSPESAQQ